MFTKSLVDGQNVNYLFIHHAGHNVSFNPHIIH
jgi:hypothetical protein